jgi:uncharacterized protein YggU (UPF0235/DUF167 family)
MTPVESAGTGLTVLSAHARPDAKRTDWNGLHGDRIRVRLKAPPVDGKVIAERCRFVAKDFGIPKRGAILISGQSSR